MKDSDLDNCSIPIASNFYVRVVQRDGGTDSSRKAELSAIGAGINSLPKCPTISGGDAANEDITIQGTSHGTRTSSYVLLQPNGGNVGIGTTSPAVKLEVAGGGIKWTEPSLGMDVNFVRGEPANHAIGYGGTVIGANIKSFLSTNVPTILANSTGVTSAAAIHFGPDNNCVSKAFGIWTGFGTVGTALTQRVTVTNDGKVGIGTNSSSVQFQVAGGGIKWTEPSLGMDVNFVRGEPANHAIGYGGTVIGANIKSFLSTNVPTILANSTGVTSAAAIHFGPDNNCVSKAFGIWTGFGTVGTALTQRVTVTNDGKVGIGTNSPSVQFQVAGGGIKWTEPSLGMDVNFVRGEPANHAIGYGGTVIGANIKSFLSTNVPTILANSTGVTSAAAIHFGPDNNCVSKAFGIWTGFGTVGTALTQRVTVTNDGKVGIGTTTPAEKLEVDGNIKASGTLSVSKTVTTGGSTGNQTIHKASGTVNFATAATSLVVTNDLCTTSSLVFVQIRTNDSAAVIKNVVPAAGSFTINMATVPAAETSVGFFLLP